MVKQVEVIDGGEIRDLRQGGGIGGCSAKGGVKDR